MAVESGPALVVMGDDVDHEIFGFDGRETRVAKGAGELAGQSRVLVHNNRQTRLTGHSSLNDHGFDPRLPRCVLGDGVSGPSSSARMPAPSSIRFEPPRAHPLENVVRSGAASCYTPWGHTVCERAHPRRRPSRPFAAVSRPAARVMGARSSEQARPFVGLPARGSALWP